MFMAEWSVTVKHELVHNNSGYLPSRKPTLALSWPSSFPSYDTLDLYLHSNTAGTFPAVSAYHLPFPPLRQLVTFARCNFEWACPVGVLKRLFDRIFPAMLVRQLVAAQLALDAALVASRPMLIKKIVKDRPACKTTGMVHELKVQLDLDRTTLVAALGDLSPADAEAVRVWLDKNLEKMTVSVPKSMLESVDPSFVLDFVCGMFGFLFSLHLVLTEISCSQVRYCSAQTQVHYRYAQAQVRRQIHHRERDDACHQT
jgi:hypothetical protein